jgi:hypothetical protein
MFQPMQPSEPFAGIPKRTNYLYFSVSMRLLNSKSLKLQQFFGENEVPRYAILSHTWDDDEFLFTDVTNGKGEKEKGVV